MEKKRRWYYNFTIDEVRKLYPEVEEIGVPFLSEKRFRVRLFLKEGGNKTIACSRLVVEINRGEKIPRSLIVYHKDGNTFNDQIENLEIMSLIDRAKLVDRKPKESKGIAFCLIKCLYCEKEVWKKRSDILTRWKDGTVGPFCNHRCKGKKVKSLKTGEKLQGKYPHPDSLPNQLFKTDPNKGEVP